MSAVPLAPAAIDGLVRPFRQLRRRHRVAVIALWVVAFGFGCLVEIRGALIQNRHTDVDVYFSAAWSVRIGSDPYDAQDANGWHYNYPPLLAVLVDPLADAPPTMHRYWLIPYPLSVGIWYLLSVGFLVVGVTQLSRSVVSVLGRHQNQTSLPPVRDRLPPYNSAARWAWRWWVLCFWPLLLCLPAIVRSMVRGQVGPLWLMLICLTAARILDRKPASAGGWLAGAICLKLMPGYLLLYPLWRRDRRMLGGSATGLLLGLVVIPWAAMGTRPFLDANRHYIRDMILPGLAGGRLDPAVEHELNSPLTSDNVSFRFVLMKLGHQLLDTPSSYDMPAFAKIGSWILGGIMTALTLFAAGRFRSGPINELLLFSLLSLILLPLCPVCHPHYYMLMAPLVVAVLAAHLGPDGRRRVNRWWLIVLAAVPLSHILTGMFAVHFLRDAGLDTWAAVLLWAAGTKLLYDRTHPRCPSTPPRAMPASDDTLVNRPAFIAFVARATSP